MGAVPEVEVAEALAIGASFTAVTVIATVTLFDDKPLLSVTLNTKLSVPL